MTSKAFDPIIQRLDELHKHFCSEMQQLESHMQGCFGVLETHLAQIKTELERRQVKRLFWQKLWQELDWLLYWAVGTGIGLAVVGALFKS